MAEVIVLEISHPLDDIQRQRIRFTTADCPKFGSPAAAEGVMRQPLSSTQRGGGAQPRSETVEVPGRKAVRPGDVVQTASRIDRQRTQHFGNGLLAAAFLFLPGDDLNRSDGPGIDALDVRAGDFNFFFDFLGWAVASRLRHCALRKGNQDRRMPRRERECRVMAEILEFRWKWRWRVCARTVMQNQWRGVPAKTRRNAPRQLRFAASVRTCTLH